MRVMSQSPDPLARMHTMTIRKVKSGTIDVKALLAEDGEFLRALARAALQEVLEAEMTEAARCRRNRDFLGGFPPKPRSVLRNRPGIPRLSGVSSRAHEGGMRELWPPSSR